MTPTGQASVLSLDKLTPHQQEKLQECLERGVIYLHLQAPAGAGKTFVAMALLLERLRADPLATALFIARNKALCFFVMRWLCTRETSALKRVELLSRVGALFEPFHNGPHVATLSRGQIELRPRVTPWAGATQVIIDEAHHIFSDPSLRAALTPYVRPPEATQRLLLLSDISQSSGTRRGMTLWSAPRDGPLDCARMTPWIAP